MSTWRIIEGDCRESLAGLEAGSVQTCVTSPPYFGLRDYGTGEWEGGEAGCDHAVALPATVSRASTLAPHRPPGTVTGNQEEAERSRRQFRDVCGKCGARRVDRQIGLEPTPDEFVEALVAVFREVRRVLRDDGTVWLNLGDSYMARQFGWNNADDRSWAAYHRETGDERPKAERSGHPMEGSNAMARATGCKPKDLIGIPWMVAFALRADGWYLRSDIIWNKPNPMPESVTDRPTKAHEYVFLLSKGPRYFYDADALAEAAEGREDEPRASIIENGHSSIQLSGRGGFGGVKRNKRSVWTVATQPYAGAHFATFPPKLIEPCILAGSSPKACGECGAPWQRVMEREGSDMATTGWEPTCAHDDPSGSCVVLDPFAGAGTTGMVALRHDRSFVGCELNPEYAQMARYRIRDDSPLFNTFAEHVA